MSWIEGPGTIGIDGEAIDGSTDQLVADLGIIVVNIFCCLLYTSDAADEL